jgi:hypothetical protein
MEEAGASDSSGSSSSSFLPVFAGRVLDCAVYPFDVSDLRQWGIVEKYCDTGYGDCVKTPS